MNSRSRTPPTRTKQSSFSNAQPRKALVFPWLSSCFDSVKSRSRFDGGLMCVSDRNEIERALLSYLFENTAARDSLEGIVEWWLLDRKIRQTTSVVKDVLDELVAKKLILEYEKGD